jgi:hypothetical protein
MRPALPGTRAPADSLRVRYMRNSYSDIYQSMLTRLADSLARSLDQIQTLQKERELLRGRADSAYKVLSDYLAALPAGYDRKGAIKHVTDTDSSVWDMIYAERTFLKATLTPGQIRLLPGPIFQMITVPNYKGRFFGF